MRVLIARAFSFSQQAPGVLGLTQPVEQPFQSIAGQYQIEVLPVRFGFVEQSSTHGCADIRFIHARLSR